MEKVSGYTYIAQIGPSVQETFIEGLSVSVRDVAEDFMAGASILELVAHYPGLGEKAAEEALRFLLLEYYRIAEHLVADDERG